MQEVTFTLRVLTPLFLAGADQETAELRAPSFRGLMRYWYRALVGGVIEVDEQRLEEVIKAETELFGSTAIGSSVRIRVSQPSSKPSQFTDNISKPGGARQTTGKGYLLWSMRLKKPPRYYFAPNTSFSISLSTYGTDSTKHQKGIAALWLLTYLGGVGSRSRRCAGSLTITGQDGDVFGFPFSIPADVKSLKSQIEQGIVMARSLYTTTRFSVNHALFDILSQKTCRIWILQHEHPWETAEKAMIAIGESLQSHRSTIPPHKRKVFGFTRKGIKGSVNRCASALLLRVVELQNNKYVGLAVLFKTQNPDILPGDYAIIENWVNEFRGKQEVTL